MKKLLTIVMALVMMFSIMGGAMAQGNTTGAEQNGSTDTGTDAGLGELVDAATEEEAGITPDSFLWVLERAMEQLDLLLTFDESEKAKKGLEHARERLAEVQVMISENNLDAAAEAEEAHDEELEDVAEAIAELYESNATEELAQVEEIELELEAHQEDVEEVEAKIKVKIKGTLTDEQQTMLDALLASFAGSASEVSVKIDAKKDRTKIKVKIKEERTNGHGKSELEIEIESEDHDESDEEDDESDAAEKLEKAQKEINKAEAMLASSHPSGENVTSGDNATSGDETVTVSDPLQQAKDMLAEAQALFDAGEFSAAKELAEDAKDLAKDVRKSLSGDDSDDDHDSDDDESDDESDDDESDDKDHKKKDKHDDDSDDNHDSDDDDSDDDHDSDDDD